jgi:Carboxypeptidase regulatory-like domain
MTHRRRGLVTIVFFLMLALGLAWASITGSISGVVSDPSGAVITGAKVVAINVDTGVRTTLTTDSKGFYNFASLPVGTYDLEISQMGFRTFKKTGLVIDANSALRADATLPVGAINEKVEVNTDTVHVETESTQMGEVISGKTMTAVPLNGRAFTDLLALQPGVSPYNSTDTGMTGINDRPVDGGLNAGNQSVNGQREAANGFMVNGSNVEEGKNNGAAIIPNLDSISEFRIITNNYDAEYGNYSGGQVNVVTKSGTNTFHGSGFEFLRNTALDAKNYFSLPTDKTPVFRQNQFGGTFGGPLRKDKTFFFVDYQGTRQTQAPTVNTLMPSVANFGGNFSDSAGSFVTTDSSGNTVPTSVNGTGFAAVLNQRMNSGSTIFSGEPYYFSGCTSLTQCVFPNAQIPRSMWSPVAVKMLALGLIPEPNAPNNFFETSAYAKQLRDDKGGIRIDQNTRFGTLFAYYFADDYLLNDPYPNSGVNNAVPATGFDYNANVFGRAQLINLGDTKNFGAYSVNEFRFSYVRNTLHLDVPQGGVGSNYSLSNLGFVTPWDPVTGGISPVVPSLQGVPSFNFNNFIVGVPEVTTKQYNNSFQWLDNFSKVIGTHSLKFGGQFHYDQIDERNLAGENGQYQFTGTETGIDFADFLIGAPDNLTQASLQLLDSRSKYYGLFAQDSWRGYFQPGFQLRPALGSKHAVVRHAEQNRDHYSRTTVCEVSGRAAGLCGGRRSWSAANPGANPVAQFLTATRARVFTQRVLRNSGQVIRRSGPHQYPYGSGSLLHFNRRSFAVPGSWGSALWPLLRQCEPAPAGGAVLDPFHRHQRRKAFSVPISSSECFADESGSHLPVGASRAALLRLVFRPQKQVAVFRAL